MELVLEQVVYHMYSDNYKNIDVKLSNKSDVVVVSAYFNEKEIYHMESDKKNFMESTDLEIIHYAVSKLAEDHKNWRDVSKCRALVDHTDEFQVQSKDSNYTMDHTGAKFGIKVHLENATKTFSFKMVNNMNSDVITCSASASSEVEMTDNVLLYAQVMREIALSFKIDQTMLIQHNEKLGQHQLSIKLN